MIYTPLTRKAMRIAYEAHHGQFDETGVPYVFHPFHVAEQMTDEITTCMALLHDVVEDTDVTFEDLEREFPGEFRAANIEYRYNAEERPVYYYVDHVEEGGVIEKIPPEPTREGYEFKGWFTDENGTQAWDFSQPIRTGEQESLKLFARWQKLP